MKIAPALLLVACFCSSAQLRAIATWPVAAAELAALYSLFFGLLKAVLRWTQEQ